MSYSDFKTIDQAVSILELTVEDIPHFFSNVAPIERLSRTCGGKPHITDSFLENYVVKIDLTEYFISQLNQILGILAELFRIYFEGAIA
jgi:hypothetical protein